MLLNQIKLNLKEPITIGILLLISCSLLLRIISIPFNIPLKLDAIDYLSFAVVFSSTGNYPIGILPTNDGWSIFLSPFFYFIGNENLMNLVNTQRLLSSIISSLTIIPIYFLLKKFLSKESSLIAIALFAFNPKIIENSTLGLSEPLFIFLIISSIVFALAVKNLFYFLSFISVAFATIVRFEALVFFIPITLIFIFNNRKSLKNFKIFFISIFISLLIVSSIGIFRAMDDGVDGIFSHYWIYSQNSVDSKLINNVSSGEITSSQNFWINSITNTIKFLALVLFPINLFLLPFGLFFYAKNNRKKTALLLIITLFLLPAALYAYGRNFQEVKYLLVLLPILSIFSAYVFQIFNFFENFKYLSLIIFIIFLVGLVFVVMNNDEMILDNEKFRVTQFIVQNATGVNTYPGIGFLKVATLFEIWPDPLPLNDFLRTTYYVEKFPCENSNSINEFLKNSENKISHLVVLQKNNCEFLDELFNSPDNLQYVKKVFQTTKLNVENDMYVFEIDYEIFKKLNT